MRLYDRFKNPLEDGDVVEFVHCGGMTYGMVWGLHTGYSNGELTVIIEYFDSGPLKKMGAYSNRDITKVSDAKALLWKLENL